jgi:hypothetical protein
MDAGAARGVDLDCTSCRAFLYVTTAKLLGEVGLLVLACDDEDGAPSKTGAIDELDTVQAPIAVHEASDTHCLRNHPGGLETRILGGIELLTVCQEHDIGAPTAEQQCPLHPALGHTSQAQLREWLATDLPTMAVWAGNNIPTPQLRNTWHIG